jgi:cytochrome P450
MNAFIKFPGELDKARNNIELAPSVVDEALRFVSPVKHFQRVVTREFEFRGRELHEGDHVMILYVSANRDEDVFEDPDVFNITRRPNRHMAFGHGAHMCLGRHVAKLEMQILLEELLPHIKSVDLVGTPKSVSHVVEVMCGT